jgi:hypothetical protein
VGPGGPRSRHAVDDLPGGARSARRASSSSM